MNAKRFTRGCLLGFLTIGLGIVSGCYVGVDIAEVRKTVSNNDFSIPDRAEMAGLEIAILRSFDVNGGLDIDESLIDLLQESELRQVIFSPKGINSLAFVDRLKLSIGSNNDSLPTITPIDYTADQSGGRIVDGKLVLEPNVTGGYTEYFKEDSEFLVDLVYTSPGEAWAFDVELVFDVVFRYGF